MASEDPLTPSRLWSDLRQHPLEFAFDLTTGVSWWVRGMARPTEGNHVDGPVVLILSGVWEPSGFLATLQEDLTESGYAVHLVPTMGLSLAGIDDLAARAEAHVREHDLRDIVVVGHSKGGLVAKTMLLGPERGRLRGAVTISAPFNGSTWARFLPEAAGVAAIKPDSATLRRLHHHSDVNHLITSIGSQRDLIVPEGTHLPGGRNVQLDIVGHYLPISDVGGVEVVREEVARRFGSPPPIDIQVRRLHRHRAQWTIVMATQLTRDELRRRLFDARRHEAAVPLTTATGAPDGRLDVPGRTFAAVTAGMLADRMTVVSADDDHVHIRKLGPLLSGDIHVEFPTHDTGTFLWRQSLQVKLLPSWFTPFVGGLGRRAYAAALRRIIAMEDAPQ